jgi:hypothetical protein
VSNERSVTNGAPLGSIPAKVTLKLRRLAQLRPAKLWHDRFQKGRHGSYKERKKAISDYIRFLAFCGQPVRQIFADAWVKATIQQAANEADATFFKQFGEKLKDPLLATSPQQSQRTTRISKPKPNVPRSTNCQM